MSGDTVQCVSRHVSRHTKKDSETRMTFLNRTTLMIIRHEDSECMQRSRSNEYRDGVRTKWEEERGN